MSRFAEKRKHSRKQRAEQRRAKRSLLKWAEDARHILAERAATKSDHEHWAYTNPRRRSVYLRKPWLDPYSSHAALDDLNLELSMSRRRTRRSRTRRNCGGRRNPEVSVDSFSPRPQFGEWLISHSSKKRGDAIYELGVIWAEKGTAYGYSLIEAVKSARARAKGRNATVFKRISAKLTALLHGRGRKVNPKRKHRFSKIDIKRLLTSVDKRRARMHARLRKLSAWSNPRGRRGRR